MTQQLNYVLAFDPGGTTGWALGEYSNVLPLSFIDGGQIPDGVEGFNDFVPVLLKRLTGLPKLRGNLSIVSESFQLRPGVKAPDVTPLRIEGAQSVWFGRGGVEYQQPAIKALVPDVDLKRLGFWIPGQRHQMDARIHALAYMKRTRHMPTLQAYWSDATS